MKYHTSIGIGWHQSSKITTIDISKVLTLIVKVFILASYLKPEFKSHNYRY